MPVSAPGKAALIIWFAFLQAVLVYGALLFVVEGGGRPMKIHEVSVLSFAAFVAFVPHLFRYFDKLRGAHIALKLAIAEMPGMLALVLHILTERRGLALKMAAISLLSILFLFPSGSLKRERTESKGGEAPPPIE